jgi:hypothetical protein
MPVTNATAPPSHAAKPTVAAKKTETVLKARTDALTGLGQLAQVPLIATKQYADAGAVGLHWPEVAKEIATLADSEPRIAQLIDPLIKVGPYTGLIAAILPFVLQLGVNHGRVQAGVMGTVPSSTLDAQVQSSLAKAELEALTAQHEAEQAAAAMREEIAESRRAMANTIAGNKTVVE